MNSLYANIRNGNDTAKPIDSPIATTTKRVFHCSGDVNASGAHIAGKSLVIVPNPKVEAAKYQRFLVRNKNDNARKKTIIESSCNIATEVYWPNGDAL